MSDYILKLKEISDQRGSLVAVEAFKNLPFEIKRVYYLYKLSQFPRGFHAHKTLRQFMVCLHGTVKVILDDGLGNKNNILLKNPNEGILIEPYMWHEMFEFSNDCVLVVFANDYYNEGDYIRSYDEFQVAVRSLPSV